MPLYLDTGFSSARGARGNEESCLIAVPNPEQDTGHGALLAIADGIAERPAPETAARDALRALGDHYYAAPENWVLKHSLQESVAAANHAVINAGERERAAAMSALVLRRRRWAAVHAGNTRIWLMRGNQVRLLTRDHVSPRMARAPQVERAFGLRPQLENDYLSGELAEGDVFVLTNAAAHDTLTGADILACAVTDTPAAQIAALIVERAARAGGGANAGASVVRIEQLPPETREDLEEDVAALPAVAPPQVGDTIDDFRIERLVHKSSRYRLYKATDIRQKQTVALKFPNPRDAESDPGFAETFLREEWIGRRVTSPHLLRTLPLHKGRRTVLYSVMAYPSGENLAKRLARKGTLPLRETTFIGGQLLEALTQLHDQGIIHNDVRPQNIVMDRNGGHLMLLGLGTSYVPQADITETSSGMPSRRANFLAPELLGAKPEPTIRSDIYSAGVILYRMLTGSYPYGKIGSNDRPPSGDYVAITTHDADLPQAIDTVLARACAFDAHDRFDTAHEFAEAIDAAMAQQLDIEAERRTPLRTRSRRSWEIVAIVSLVVVLVGYLIFTLHK